MSPRRTPTCAICDGDIHSEQPMSTGPVSVPFAGGFGVRTTRRILESGESAHTECVRRAT